MGRLSILLLGCVVLWMGSVVLAEGAGTEQYLQGLTALENRQWADAAQAFGKAAEADDDNADYHAAHGVACMMAGDNRSAQSEFDRAVRLDPKNETTRRWAAGFYRFIGDALTASKINSPSDYTGTVVEAAEKVYQIRWEQLPPVQQQARRDALDQFAMQYGSETKANHPDLARAQFVLVKQNFDQGHFDVALRDDLAVMNAFPQDMEPLFYHAGCTLFLGDALRARTELTTVLSAETDFGGAYGMRAVAEARIGNLKRARADLELAKKYNPAVGGKWEPFVQQELGKYTSDPANDSPDEKWAALQQTVAAGKPWEEQATAAVALYKAQNAKRLRWDELFQDRLRQLEDAIRENPKDVNRVLAEAWFLYNESAGMGEQMAPGGPYRTYRLMYGGAAWDDMARADRLFDQALKLDSNNALAMTGKAAICLDRLQWDQGNAYIQKALAIRTDLPELLQCLARVLNYTAEWKQYDANDLRTTKTWTTFGIDYYTIWWRHPSQGELAQANDLERQANALWAQAEGSMRAAVKARAGTPDGFYYNGLLRARGGDAEGAVKDYESAVAAVPTDRRYQEALMQAYAKLGRTADAVRVKETLTLQRQTTATARLAAVWEQIDGTRYKAARETLAAARQVDPADVRVPAYNGALSAVQHKPEEAITWYRMALAMEEGRARVAGKTLGSDESPVPAHALAADIGDVGWTIELNLQAAARFAEMHRVKDALPLLKRNVYLESRLPMNVWLATIDQAVLPNQAGGAVSNRIWAQAPVTIFAWSRMYLGHALLEANDAKSAYQQFATVCGWGEATRGSGDNGMLGGRIYDAKSLCQAGATRLQWSTKDPNTARRAIWLQNAKAYQVLSDNETRALQSVATDSRQQEMNAEADKMNQDAYNRLTPQQQAQMRQLNELQRRRQQEMQQEQEKMEAELRRRGQGGYQQQSNGYDAGEDIRLKPSQGTFGPPRGGYDARNNPNSGYDPRYDPRGSGYDPRELDGSSPAPAQSVPAGDDSQMAR